jgi:hypothetical protein
MTEEYFSKLNIPFPVMDLIYDELRTVNWYTSSTGQCRGDVSAELRSKIQKVITLKIYCCGYFKNDPGFKYPIHKDSARRAAINILLVDNCDEFNIFFYSDDLKTKILVPYIRDDLLLINTKKFHSVNNTSLTKTRYLMSIGFVENTYDEIKAKSQYVQS